MPRQVAGAAFIFYDAPTDSGGVFDDFVAIEHDGNVSTTSYPEHIINEYSTGFFGSTRSVTCYHVMWNNKVLTRYPTLSNFYQSVPIIQYSPAVIDAFVNRARVSSRAHTPSLLHVDPLI